MSPEITRKTPTEQKIFTMNFGRQLNPGATITQVVSVSAEPAGLSFASNTVLPSGQAVSTRISGGTAGANYIVKVVVDTSDGENIDESGRLQVRLSKA